jgi:hypothetical protein
MACSALITRAATQSPTTWHGGAGGGVVPKSAAGFGVEIAGIRNQAVLIAIGNGNARQRQIGAREARSCGCRAETVEIHD